MNKKRLKLVAWIAALGFVFATYAVDALEIDAALAIAVCAVLMLVAGAVIALAGRRYGDWFRALAKADYRRCPKCEHSLKGLADEGRCPECGEPFDRAGLEAAWREHARR